jgi:3-methyladenine DNA glycosylase AlkD
MDLNSSLKVSLQTLAEPDYQKFSSNLLPGISNILGVRLPLLRKIAKKLSKSDWEMYLNQALDDSFEEIMLQGMTIGYVSSDLSTILPYVTNFVAKIDNWSICDSFCSSLKLPKQYPKEMWNYILPYLTDTREYYVRFGVVMLIFYYIDEEHIDNVLYLLDDIKHSGYYVRMAVAWAVSICYINFPQVTMNYLTNNTLDDDTYNKSLQKIVESLKIDSDTKKFIKSLRRR